MDVEIKKTNNYGLFKFNKQNRAVNSNHVNTLQNKISSNDKSHLNPIIVNKDFEIVDGQHRFYALQKLNKPIYYIVDNNFNTSDLIEFNVDQKNWDNDDYLNYYIQTGNIYYKQIKRFKQVTNLKWHILLKLLVFYERGQNPIKIFKTGKVERLKNLNRAYDIAGILNKLESEFKSINQSLFGAIAYLYDFHKNEIDFDLLVSKIHEYSDGEKLTPKSNVKEQIRALDDIYNLRKKNKVQFSAYYSLNKN